MKPVYLHIGLPKTGTTALQNWLGRHSSALREKGIFTFNRVALAHKLAAEGIVNLERRAEPDIVEILACDWERVQAELRKAVSDDKIREIVISSEYFSIADASTVRQKLIAMDVINVSIIVTLRRQDRFLESAYCQEVFLMGRTEPIDPPQYDKRYDWHRIVSAWAESFNNRIKILLYDQIISEGGSVANEIIRNMDEALCDIAAENERIDDNINVSLPAKIVEIKRLANRLGSYEFYSFINLAIESSIDDTKFRMDSEQAKAHMDFYRSSNRAIARDLLHLDGDLFDETDLALARVGADYTGRLPVELLAALFALYKNEERPAQNSRVLERSAVRGSAELTREQDIQIKEANSTISQLVEQVEERNRQLTEADGTIKQLLQQLEGLRNLQLKEADCALRKLRQETAERDRQLVEADSTIRQLLEQVEERNRRLTEADGTIKQLVQQLEESPAHEAGGGAIASAAR